MPSTPRILEVCVASVHDAEEAVAGGADRLELNSALELGGLTPSSGLLAEVKRSVTVPVIVMIRPRAAGFCYGESELRTMLWDTQHLLDLGADGIAFGVLDSHMQVDVRACRRFVELAGDRDCVFHRAFDVINKVDLGIQHLIELGMTRLLTSGQAETAVAGADMLAHLQQTYGNRIEILPAAGVGPSNVRQLLDHTACTQIHGSFAQSRCDRAGVVVESAYRTTDRSMVRAVRRQMQ